MSPETWRSVLQPSNENPFGQSDVFHRYANHSLSQSSSRKTSDSSDSSAAELLMLDPSIIQVGEARPLTPYGIVMGTNGNGSRMHSWSDFKNTLGIRENGMQDPSTENSSFIPYSSPSTLIQTRIGTVTNGMGTVNRHTPTATSEAYPAADTISTSDKMRRLSTDSQNTRIHALIPTRVPTLAMHNVEDIDLDLLLDSFPVAAERGPWENKREQRLPLSGGGDGAQIGLFYNGFEFEMVVLCRESAKTNCHCISFGYLTRKPICGSYMCRCHLLNFHLFNSDLLNVNPNHAECNRMQQLSKVVAFCCIQQSWEVTNSVVSCYTEQGSSLGHNCCIYTWVLLHSAGFKLW